VVLSSSGLLAYRVTRRPLSRMWQGLIFGASRLRSCPAYIRRTEFPQATGLLYVLSLPVGKECLGTSTSSVIEGRAEERRTAHVFWGVSVGIHSTTMSSSLTEEWLRFSAISQRNESTVDYVDLFYIYLSRGFFDYGLVSISVLAAILNGLMHIARLWNTSSHLEAQESCLWTSGFWTRFSQSRLVRIELLCYARPSVRHDFNLLQLALTPDIGYSPEVDLFDVRASLQLTAIVPTVQPFDRSKTREEISAILHRILNLQTRGQSVVAEQI
jgi:hypothetical protein